MSSGSGDRADMPTDPDDIEELIAEARRDHDPSPQENWNSIAELVKALMSALPGAQVSCGATCGRSPLADYLSPTPNAPVTLFGPEGRFIVSFLGDGRWIEADGGITSTAGIIEGSPEALARHFIRIAGLKPPPDTRGKRSGPRHAPRSDGLRRLRRPRSTGTWRDNVGLPFGERWNEHTPASLCRESQSSRLIAVTYDENSCTFSRTSHPRWGIESLRVPDFIQDPSYPTWQPPIDPVHVGDCLLTIGGKFEADEDQLQFDQEIDGVRVWFPQRVVHTEPEGSGHLRVWLAWDKDVGNDSVTLGELNVPVELPTRQPQILAPDQAFALWRLFQLNVFCPECGNRAKPIVYGMVTSANPSYLANGGCTVESDQPRYTCNCGMAWTDEGGMSP